MKLTAQIDGETPQQITLTRKDGRVQAEIDGRHYDLEARPAVNGAYLLLHEGRVFNCLAQGGNVIIGGHEYAVKLTNPKQLHAGAGAALEKSGELKAQMPGKVARVLLNEGDAVEAGTPIMVVEAMKMQNEMKAPRDGVIKTVKVAAGDTVNAGDVLAVIE